MQQIYKRTPMSQWAIYKTRNTGKRNGMWGMRGTRGMFTKIPENLLEDSGDCWRRFRGMLKRIPWNVPEDPGEWSKRIRGMFKKIPGIAQEDSEECWQRFSKILKKIERFIMQLNENRIKGYILKYNQKCAQKFIKTSHVNEHV